MKYMLIDASQVNKLLYANITFVQGKSKLLGMYHFHTKFYIRPLYNSQETNKHLCKVAFVEL